MAECPVGWVCRGDHLCWSTPGDAGFDAYVPMDGGHDAWMGCAPESCNGRDDDCDGLIDEQVLTVSPAVTAIGDSDLLMAMIAPQPEGFAVIGTTLSGPTMSSAWSTIGADGGPTSSPTRSDATVMFFTALASGTQVVAASAISPTEAGFRISDIDFTSPAMPRAEIMVADAAHEGFPIITTFDGTVGTVYWFTTDTVGVSRARFNVASSSVTPGSGLTDVGWGPVAAVHTTAADFLALLDAAGDLVLDGAVPGDDTGRPFRSVDTIATIPTDPGTGIADTVNGLEISIRDTARPVSATNPIAVVWTTSSHGSATTHFTEITGTTPWTVSTPRTIDGTRGAFGPHSIALVPAMSGSAIDPPHWIVAIMGTDGAPSPMEAVQVFEVTADHVREIVVPDEQYTARQQVFIAESNGVLRLAEAGNSGGIVTRSIGCE